eukprot:CAMPEP_0172792540 /NCGR_PEP_ID=MMETSP1074-20121228/209025_1 /TAXON_ID=2916 /ORGANISM="Ceratium fusus, Strain PA161109" /LENGTH=74 /DNA_ID=CAMNT_0013629607 /DNA_START=529 /DNA_END=750 /DNA_ORIENTATION=+
MPQSMQVLPREVPEVAAQHVHEYGIGATLCHHMGFNSARFFQQVCSYCSGQAPLVPGFKQVSPKVKAWRAILEM